MLAGAFCSQTCGLEAKGEQEASDLMIKKTCRAGLRMKISDATFGFDSIAARDALGTTGKITRPTMPHSHHLHTLGGTLPAVTSTGMQKRANRWLVNSIAST